MTKNSESKLELRGYQQKILSIALEMNTIAFLPTGAGKTLIAVSLIKERLRLMKQKSNKVKLIAFLAPTKILVGQQKRYIKKHCEGAEVVEFTGESTNSLWGRNMEKMMRSLNKIEVLVVTPELMKNMLLLKYCNVEDIDCIIFDECHHAVGNDPMNIVCQIIRNSKCRIFGMTASPIACKNSSIVAKINELEKNLNSKLICSQEILDEFRRIIPVPHFSLFRYHIKKNDAVANNGDYAISELVTSSNFKALKNIIPEQISVHRDQSAILVNAYSRIKFANYMYLIYKFMRTVNMNPSDFEEFKCLNLPDKELKATNVTRIDANKIDKNFDINQQNFNSKNKLLFANSDLYCYLPQLVQAFGQIINIAEEFGVICALHSLQLCLRSNNNLVNYSSSILSENTSNTVEAPSSFNASMSSKKLKYNPASNDITTIIDLDKLSIMADDIKNGPFQAMDIMNSEYAACVSMLDYFIAFASCFVPALIFNALKVLVNKYYSERVMESNENNELLNDDDHNNEEENKNDNKKEEEEEEEFFKHKSFVITENIDRHSNFRNWIPTKGKKIAAFDIDSLVAKELKDSFKKMSTSFALVCHLLFRVMTTDRFSFINLTVEGVLVLVEDFCKEIREENASSSNTENNTSNKEKNRERSGVLKDEEVKEAIYEACSAMLRCISQENMKTLFMVNDPANEFAFEPLQERTNKKKIILIKKKGRGFKRTSASEKKKKIMFEKHGKLMFNIPLVSTKLKGLYHVWAIISATQQKKILNIDDDLDKIKVDMIEENVTNSDDQYNSLILKSLLEYDMRDIYLPSWKDAATLVDDWAGIVFCRMRLSAICIRQVLFKLFDISCDNNIDKEKEVLEKKVDSTDGKVNGVDSKVTGIDSMVISSNLIETTTTTANESEKKQPFRPLHLVGNTSQKFQLDTLFRFKTGEYNVLFATDVAEEGLDVRACQLVINLDVPSTLKSFIQRRGRARATQSTIIALVPYGKSGDEMIDELMRFTRQENEIYKSGISEENIDTAIAELNEFGEIRTVAIKNDEKVLLNTNNNDSDNNEQVPIELDFVMEKMVSENKSQVKVIKKDTTKKSSALDLLKSMYSDDDDEEEEEGEVNEEKEKVFRYKRSDSLSEGEVDETDEISQEIIPITTASAQQASLNIYERFFISSTGAAADSRSATQLLIRFCQQLPHDSYYSPVPIFFIKTIPLFTGFEYQCSILLPSSVPARYRCFTGRPGKNKMDGKGSAALECIKALHACGEVNDLLQTNGAKNAGKSGIATTLMPTQPIESKLSIRKKNKRKAGENNVKIVDDVVKDESKDTVPEFLTVSGVEETTKVVIKIVPDFLTRPPEVFTTRRPEVFTTRPPEVITNLSSEHYSLIKCIDKSFANDLKNEFCSEEFAENKHESVESKSEHMVIDNIDQKNETNVFDDDSLKKNSVEHNTFSSCDDGDKESFKPLQTLTKLYLYSVNAKFFDELTKDAVVGCHGCHSHFHGMNQIGIALAQPLPEDLFATEFDTALRESEVLKVRIKLIESRLVSEEDMLQMQRFHRSVICWESEIKRYFPTDKQSNIPSNYTSGLDDEVWIPLNANIDDFLSEKNNLNSKKILNTSDIVSHDVWRESSNGAWYILFPLPPEHVEYKKPEDKYPMDEFEKLAANGFPIFADPLVWTRFLKKCADEAQILVHNLRMQYQLNMKEIPDFDQPFFDAEEVRNNPDVLISRGPGGIYNIVVEEDDCKRKLSDVLKYVRKDSVTGEIKRTRESSVQLKEKLLNELTKHDEKIIEEIDVKDCIACSEKSLNKCICCNGTTEEEIENESVKITKKRKFDETTVQNKSNGKKEKNNISLDTITAVTYAEQLLTKNSHLKSFIDDRMKVPDYYLQSTLAIATRITLVYLLGCADIIKSHRSFRFMSNVKKREILSQKRTHSHTLPIHLLPEICRCLGKSKWLEIGLNAPSIMWRIQSLLLSVEARDCVMDAMVEYKKKKQLIADNENFAKNSFIHNNENQNHVETSLIDKEEKNSNNSSNSDNAIWTGARTINTNSFGIPKVVLMLEAITPRMARESFDSERLEMLGDSLTKFVTTVELFRIYPEKHEGFLTDARSKVISNMFQYDMARKFGFDKYLRAYSLSSGKQFLRFRPPGMNLNRVKNGLSIWNLNIVTNHSTELVNLTTALTNKKDKNKKKNKKKKEKNTEVANESQGSDDEENEELEMKEYIDYKSLYSIPQHATVNVKAKILADLIEAIIGAFYLEGGINMAIDAMKALGVWPTFGIDDLLAASFQSELKTIVVENNNEENKDNKLETIKNNKNNNVEKELNESLETATRKDMKKRTMDGNGVLFTTDAFKETLEDDSINQFNFPPEYPELMRKVAEGTATLDAIKRMEKSFSEPSSIVDNQFYLNKCGKIEQAKQISELNKKIGYTFKNTKLMDEAFTHCSLSCKKSNQRLEFLGDAVLDFAIVSLLFKHLPWATQGDLSGGKSNAACNKNLAYFCADLELYKFLKLASPQLALDIEAIHEIVVNNKKKMSNNNINNNSNNDNNNGEISQNKEQEKKEDINSNEELKILENNDEDENIKKKRKVRRNDDNIVMNEIEEDKKKLKVFGIKGVVDLAAGPMKALADTFEAIIGAIYLDSGGSMEAICKVIKHINLLPALSNSNSNSNSS